MVPLACIRAPLPSARRHCSHPASSTSPIGPFACHADNPAFGAFGAAEGEQQQLPGALFHAYSSMPHTLLHVLPAGVLSRLPTGREPAPVCHGRHCLRSRCLHTHQAPHERRRHCVSTTLPACVCAALLCAARLWSRCQAVYVVQASRPAAAVLRAGSCCCCTHFVCQPPVLTSMRALSCTCLLPAAPLHPTQPGHTRARIWRQPG